MKVKLTYFKPSGKYYAEGTFDTTEEHLHEIWEEVERMADNHYLPELVRNHSDYVVLIDVPEHPHNHPHIVNMKTVIREYNERLLASSNL